MNVHKNASMTPKGRAHLVQQIDLIGLMPAASAAGISPRTARKWHARHAAQGPAGLLDRSSRPRRSPARSDAAKRERAVALRRTQRLTYERIAERVGLSKSDLLPASHTKLKERGSVNQENGGHEEEQIHRGTDHRVPQAG